MTNRAFLQNVEFAVAAFQDSPPRRVLSVSHNDGDGLTASVLVTKTMAYLGIPCSQVIFDRSASWDRFFDDTLRGHQGTDTVIISDLGAEELQISTYFNSKPGITAYLMDHHKISSQEHVDSYPRNVYSLNATRFGLDGLKEIAGSTLVYLFCSRLSGRAARLAWLPVVGMAGDALENPAAYRSFNKEVLEHAAGEGIIELHEGAALLGGMAEKTLQESMSCSLLPFLPGIGGNPDVAARFLSARGIDPGMNVLDVDDDTVTLMEQKTGKAVRGSVAMIPSKSGLYKHAFEYNFFIGILGDTDQAAALQALDKAKPTRTDVTTYHAYAGALARQLGTITGGTGITGNAFIIIEIPPVEGGRQLASDVASFTSVNQLLPGDKLLLLSSVDSPGQQKLSVRCSPAFVSSRGMGAGAAIEKLVSMFGGRGGGHDLAGGWLLPRDRYDTFIASAARIDSEVLP